MLYPIQLNQFQVRDEADLARKRAGKMGNWAHQIVAQSIMRGTVAHISVKGQWRGAANGMLVKRCKDLLLV